MAKKWTTLRKIDSPQGEEKADGARKDKAPTSRIPRRRQLARQKSEPEEGDSDQKNAEADSEEKVGPVRPLDVEEPQILIVHDAAATYRLVEETFTNFTRARVDSTSDVLTAFELAIRKDYQLFVIALNLPGISGSLFYEIISRAYITGLGEKKLAPAVVFIREANETLPSDELIQDVRVKAVWSKPLNIERMLDSVSGVIKRRAT